jgi:hypothetical protein
MDPRTRARSRRRLAIPLLLAIALAAEASGAALAVPRHAPTGGGITAAPGGGLAAAPPAFAAARVGGSAVEETRSAPPIADFARRSETTATRAFEGRLAALRATPAATAVTETIASKAAPSAGYRGTNHVWIPSLGVSRPVSFFSCSSSAYPGNRVYRWGCGGTNNVYLFGHAASVFKPLHDAYVRGRLRAGMEVVYADSGGRITRYAVSWWKVVAPDGDVGWAYAAQARPSMTLQTCVGANSAFRLVVRLSKKG